MAHIVKTTEEFDAIVKGEKPVLVDFFATWCGPCKMFAPTFDEFASEHEEIACVKVDVDECGELARRFGIMSIPTIILSNSSTHKTLSMNMSMILLHYVIKLRS